MRKNDKKSTQKRSRLCRIETLEQLTLMSASPNGAFEQPVAMPLSALTTTVGPTVLGTPSKAAPATTSTAPNAKWFSPANIEAAYGITTLANSGYTGAGQTIAIVLAYDVLDNNLQSDLNTFDKAYSIPDVTINSTLAHSYNAWEDNATPPNAPVVNGTDAWGREAALDVEWAHAIAPKANIDVFESQSAEATDMLATVDLARKAPGVSVVSMSWAFSEDQWVNPFTNANIETASDATFTTPAGHIPVTFISASGDSGGPNADPRSGPQYPASSPNVLSVGATSLTMKNGGYGAETGWNLSYVTTTNADGSKTTSAMGSGGGISEHESQPSYMKSFMPSVMRTTPDVSFVGDVMTPVNVYHTAEGGWTYGAGTSFATQAWAGIIALANQGRVNNKLTTLAHADQDIYQLPASDFHDITSGNNGYLAIAGYDMVTGRGTPKANVLVPDLVKPEIIPTPPLSGPTYLGPSGPQAAVATTGGSTSTGAPTKTATAANVKNGATPVDPLFASVAVTTPKLGIETQLATAGNTDDFLRTIDSLFGDETETFGMKHKRVALR